MVAQTINNPSARQETLVQSLVKKIPWRKKWQPTPAFLPGESHGQKSLAGYGPRGRKELDTTERLTPSQIAVLYRSLQTTPDAGPEGPWVRVRVSTRMQRGCALHKARVSGHGWLCLGRTRAPADHKGHRFR